MPLTKGRPGTDSGHAAQLHGVSFAVSGLAFFEEVEFSLLLGHTL